MKITSKQEMLDFGEQFAKSLKRVTDLGGLPRSSRREEPWEGKVWQDPLKGVVIELVGDVGAGKTTFVRGLAKGLGIQEPVTSPSFTISKSYALPDGRTLTHYDFYRLQDPGLMMNDLKEKIEENNIIIIEWGNSIQKILPDNRIIINISKNNDNSREINIKDNRSNAFSGVFVPYEVQRSAGSPVTTGRAKRLPKSVARLSLYLDTSTPTTILKLNDHEYQWDSGRELAEKLLQFIHDKLQENNKDWHDLTEITFMSGPGSFTGLRIGATVVNTLATELNIPLYDHEGNQVKIILPNYGHGANISTPRK